MRLVRDPRARLGHLVNFEPHVGMFVLTREAVNELEDLLQPCGEFLSLICDDGEFVVYNVTTTVDALDEDASDMDRSFSDRIIRLNRPVFNASAIHADVFKVPQTLFDRFVTDEFARRVNESGLLGFDLQPCEVH